MPFVGLFVVPLFCLSRYDNFFFKKKFGEVSSALSGDTNDEGNFDIILNKLDTHLFYNHKFINLTVSSICFLDDAPNTTD